MTDENQSRYDRITEQLKNKYRLVVMNDDTFEEVGSYRLTWLNVYIIVSIIFVLVVSLVVAVFVFTPVKQYLPGYGDVNQREKMYEIQKRVGDLEAELNARTVYIRSVRDALTQNVKYEPTVVSEEELSQQSDSFLNVQPIKEDYQLREEVERDELFSVSLPSTTSNFKAENRTLEQMLFVTPVKGTISDGFRPENKHYGVDVIAAKNTPVKTIADGYVITSDWTYDTGNVIAVQHENNIISFYKHNSVLLKKVGSFVKAGEAVAIIGNTGEMTDGPHLHFELWNNGKPVNPEGYIDFD